MTRYYVSILEKILDASNRGLDIITDVCPAAAEVANNPKKKFRLRSDERTPSAQLYPPRDANDCWHVKDYGMGDGGGYFTSVDLYMWSKGYGQERFSMALQELAEQYNVQEELKGGTNKPLIEQRPTQEDERGRPAYLELFEGFGGMDLTVWGPAVHAEHLSELGWYAVKSITRYGDDKTTIIRATDDYPIYAERCTYADGDGNEQLFWKVYEPKNYDKQFRFSFIGQKPKDYVYGLDVLRRKWRKNGEERLPQVLLVSGGSDAVNALSMGYQPVWLDSETRLLRATELQELQKYADRVINIPDIDETGMRMGMTLALSLPTLFTSWLTQKDFGGTHDNRRRLCKDLKDYVRLHPQPSALRALIGRAHRAQFWEKQTDDKGKVHYSISQTSLDYFLMLNGYCTLKDDSQPNPQYIHISGMKVRPIVAKTIANFLKEWCEEQGVDEALQNTLLSKRTLPNNTTSTLTERDDLDFTNATPKSQRFYFQNGWIELTAEKIVRNSYSNTNGGNYVWVDAIIKHDYRDMKPMFDVSKDDKGGYHLTIDEKAPSKLLRFVINSSRMYWRKKDEHGILLTEEEKAEEEQCILNKITNLGYLMHSYKSESATWATLCLDNAMTESDECNGGSGKSFYLNAVGKLLNPFPIDGRTMQKKGNTQFLFDGVSDSTGLIIVDECPRDFDYNFFYGMITNDLRVEKKGQNSRVIPFSVSPKWAFATNFTLRDHSPSTIRRLWPVTFSDYYHVKTKTNDYLESRTISDDFGQNLMGDDYSEADWQADIYFLLQCLQVYLKLPKSDRRQLPPMKCIERRELQATIGKSFQQWADEYFSTDSGHLDCEIKAEDIVNDFNRETHCNWSSRSVIDHLKNYCNFAEHIACYNPASVTGKKTDGERLRRRDEKTGKQQTCYYIQSAGARTEDTTPRQLDLDMEPDAPF